MSVERKKLIYNNQTYCWYEEIEAHSFCADPTLEPEPLLSKGKPRFFKTYILKFVFSLGGGVFQVWQFWQNSLSLGQIVVA